MTGVLEDDLMTIGRFAHISGLSVHSLRHYDDVGLLAPAAVDLPAVIGASGGARPSGASSRRCARGHYP